MRINVEIKGYYDWVPCPPGTEITEADVSSLRVKKMSDDKWHMRVTLSCEDLPSGASHHDVGIHEESLINRMAALEKGGKEIFREECVAEILRTSFRHHLHPSHIIKINVQDDGPNEELYAQELEKVGVAHPQEALDRYLEPCDLEDYLNRFFKTASFKSG